MQVTVMIPTRRRPQALAQALRSVFAQQEVDWSACELVVVDNDEGASAAAAVAALGHGAPLPVRYVHEPRPGVATARNAGMAAARGALIAFLDDDQVASARWLSSLLATQRLYAADAVFGPVIGRAPDGVRHRAYLERFFSRLGPSTSQVVETPYGCGNSLVWRAALPHPTAPFSAARDRLGGEDDLLFDTMRQAGARFAWAAEAVVNEEAAADRLTLRYALRRTFAYGQGPCYSAWHATPRRLAVIPFWMAVGVAQAAAFGVLAAWRFLCRRADRIEALDRAVQGLGKLLWFPPFKQKFYGA